MFCEALTNRHSEPTPLRSKDEGSITKMKLTIYFLVIAVTLLHSSCANRENIHPANFEPSESSLKEKFSTRVAKLGELQKDEPTARMAVLQKILDEIGQSGRRHQLSSLMGSSAHLGNDKAF